MLNTFLWGLSLLIYSTLTPKKTCFAVRLEPLNVTPC